MSDNETVRELCAICEKQNEIIKAQSAALEQLGAALLEDEKAAVAARFNALMGCDESME